MCLGSTKKNSDSRFASTSSFDSFNSKSTDPRLSLLENHVMRSKEPNILIIGAGAAGISCATKLLQYGFKKVHILEAQDRIGGRIHTIPFGENVVDLGAQWCHGEVNNVVFGIVGNLGLLETTGDVYVTFECIRSNGEVLEEDIKERLKDIMSEIFIQRGNDLRNYIGSFGEYLTEKFLEAMTLEQNRDIDPVIAREFLENFKKVETAETAAGLDEVSADGFLDYWQCEGDYLLNWKDKGYHQFLRILMKSDVFKRDLGILEGRITFNAVVEKIIWNRSDGAIEVRCKDNLQTYKADHVIVTVSLGVLKMNSDRMFSPPLPHEKKNAIQGLGFGSVMKIFLEFPVKFWPDSWTGFTILWIKDDLRMLRNTSNAWLEDIFGFYCVNYQPQTLVAWVVGYRIEDIERMEIDDLQRDIMFLLYKFLPNWIIPKPIHIARSTWTTNRNILGSYSFRVMKTERLKAGATELGLPLTIVSYAPSYDPRFRGTSSPPLALKPVVQFAGEATSEHYYSTVHGAVESGWREANRLDGYYQKSQPEELY